VKKTVSYLWMNDAGPRLSAALQRLEASIGKYQLDALRFPCGRPLVPIGDLLTQARARTTGSAFVWCNSDVELTRDPFDVPDARRVYGFFRREVPSGEITFGVDMLYIPMRVWDEVLSKDIPKLMLGASYVDWWIPRCMQKHGLYEDLRGYIDHVTHERSAAATSEANLGYQHNFREYNRWASRNGLDPIPAPRFLLPGIGHFWGLRDLARKLLSKRVIRADGFKQSLRR